MTHMVVHRAADGQAVYHETETLEEAARHVEQMRNAGQGADARIFRMQEIPIEVKTYYKVEVPAESGEAAAAPVAPVAPAAPEAAAPAAVAPEADAAAVAPVAAVAGAKPEPAGAGANGGRFGLFGKG